MTNRAFTHLWLITLVLAVCSGCNPQINAGIATFNAQATNVASTGGQIASTLAVTPVPTATTVVSTYDISADPSQLLIHVWGQVYTLPPGSVFTIVATQEQVATYIIQNLQLAGFQDSVKDGSVTLGSGQLRLDLSLVDTTGATGTGTITFQPTLDSSGRIKLNLIGSSFGSLKLPDHLLSYMGDSVEKVLMGAASDSLSKVTLNTLSFESASLKVGGTLK
jgi:hypothetical protein